MAVALGGRVAEEIVYGEDEVTTGASNDLQQVASTARQMITRFGMSDKPGPWHSVAPREACSLAAISPLNVISRKTLPPSTRKCLNCRRCLNVPSGFGRQPPALDELAEML